MNEKIAELRRAFGLPPITGLSGWFTEILDILEAQEKRLAQLERQAEEID